MKECENHSITKKELINIKTINSNLKEKKIHKKQKSVSLNHNLMLNDNDNIVDDIWEHDENNNRKSRNNKTAKL